MAFSAYSQLLETLPIAAIGFGAKGEYLFANAAFEQLWGLDLNRVSKLTAQDLDAFVQQQIDPRPHSHSAEGVFGSGLILQKGCQRLTDGRVLELIETPLALADNHAGVLQLWVNHTSITQEYQSLLVEHKLLLELINEVPDQIYFKDLDSKFTRINPALAKRYQISSPSEAIGKTDAEFYSNEHFAITRAEELQIMQSGVAEHNKLHHEIWDDGTESWNISTKMPVLNSASQVIGLVGISHDITEHKKQEADAWNRANHDDLTHLSNRSYFMEQLNSAVSRAKRQSDMVAVLLLDLDRFKEVNDTLGHSQGDALLVHMADRFVDIMRDTDIIGRLGGDEFAFVLQFTDLEAIPELLTRILAAVEKPIELMHDSVSLSASIGVAIYPIDAQTSEGLLGCADEAMYHVKHLGRAGFAFYSEALSLSTKRRLKLSTDLRSAIGTEQISVKYQPIMAANYDRIVGAEALCRWDHPELGAISPNEFIGVAEQTGQIRLLEDSILDTVLSQIAQINTMDVSPVRISINISPRRIMRDPERLRDLPNELDSLGIARSQLVLEITESLLLEANDEILDLFQYLVSQGISLSLDDFGTGYCALSNLIHLDIQQVKIDKSFVERIDTDYNSKALCSAIIGLAESLNLTVVAEGVETQSQRQLLKDLKCHYLQGYLFSRPIEASRLMAILANQRDKERLVFDKL